MADNVAAAGELIVDFVGRQLRRTVEEGEFWIGRGADCMLWLAESSVSSHHVLVQPRQGASGMAEWGVTDRSRNGTWVEDGRRRLTSAPWWFDGSVMLRLYDPSHGPQIRLSVYNDPKGTLLVAPPVNLRRLHDKLTANDRQTLSGVRAGLSDKEIAARMHVSPDAIEQRIKRIRAKIAEFAPGVEAANRVQLGNLAEQLRIDPLP